MDTRIAALGAFLLALPVGIEVPESRDSTASAAGETRFSLALGAGSYALIQRGCEGQVIGREPVGFREAGGQIEHRFRGPFVIGARGGLLRDAFGEPVPPSLQDSPTAVRTNSYINPYIAVEGEPIGVGLGWMAARRDFILTDYDFTRIRLSFHARLGNPEHFAVAALFMEAVPLYSGGGYGELGVVFAPGSRADGWVGLSAGGPFDGTGIAIRGGYRMTPASRLALQLRLGESGGASQSGISLRLDQVVRGGP